MGEYTVSIEGAPSGTYSKVRAVLNDVLGKNEWEYARPEFAFVASAEEFTAIQAGLDGLDVTYTEHIDVVVPEPAEPAEAVAVEIEEATPAEAAAPVVASETTFHVFVPNEHGRLEEVLSGLLPEGGWDATGIRAAIGRAPFDGLATTAPVGLVQVRKDGIVQSQWS